MLSTTAFGSLAVTRDTAAGTRCRTAIATTMANATPPTAMTILALRCQFIARRNFGLLMADGRLMVDCAHESAICNLQSAISRLRSFHVREGQLCIGCSIVLVLFERERDVERRLVLREVVVALGRAPGHRA